MTQLTFSRLGKPGLAILPGEFYESIVETLDILGDPEMVRTLRVVRDQRGRRNG